MKEILLTRGKIALVDDEDYDKVKDISWQALIKKPDCPRIYAYHGGGTGKRASYLMHRLIMGAKSGQEIDHINGNGLDNRKENLRFCNRSQNNANAKKRTKTSSIYKGVTYHRRDNNWSARMEKGDQYYWLGNFDDPKEAARAYDRKALELYGEYARLNFPEDV